MELIRVLLFRHKLLGSVLGHFSITFPSTLQYIGPSAITHCNSLEKVIFEGPSSLKSLDSIASDISLTNITFENNNGVYRTRKNVLAFPSYSGIDNYQ